jgi:hypothetical protein
LCFNNGKNTEILLEDAVKQLMKKFKKFLAGMWFSERSKRAGKRATVRTKTYARRARPVAAKVEAATKPKRTSSAPARKHGRKAKE